MFKKIILIVLLFVVFVFNIFSQTNFYVWRAGKKVDNGNIASAKKFYLKAIEKNSESYKANLGLGLLLSECLQDYEKALPYLEKAITKSNTKKDTVADLFFALAKCYQYDAQFEKATVYLNKLNNVKSLEDDNNAFKLELEKRKMDCEYARVNYSDKNLTANNELYIVNLGKQINTSEPEYVPVLNNENELIFTSKRKDEKQENINTLNAKYFESMYISKYSKGRFSEVRRYTVPDLYFKSKFKKGNESIVSLSSDGKKLFVYRNTKIYETSINEIDKANPKRLTKIINFDYYQNHAFLSKDGNTLYFTSESDKGIGGIDIYKTTKVKDGEWQTPENLGETINTVYDEDAPFLSDDEQTLYFSSKGYKGFGNYDVYKSTLIDGKWSVPQNVGQPINSTGDDIFLIQNKNKNFNYYSSSRKGGFGDMDIYKANYINAIDKTCPSVSNPNVSIAENKVDQQKSIEIKFPKSYTAISFEWQVNGQNINNNTATLTNLNNLASANYTISVKLIAFCDTCLEPIVACNSISSMLVKKDTLISVTTATTALVDLKTYKGELSYEQLITLGFNTNPLLFDFNKADISSTAKAILESNTAIFNQYPSLSFVIVGYTDALGTELYNIKLSNLRAKNVKNYLLKNNSLKKQFIKLLARGNSDLVNNCSTQNPCTDEQQQQNRRVVFKVFNNIQ